jgi:hypothetical protein
MDDDNDLRQKIVLVEGIVSLAEIYSTRLSIIGNRCYIAVDGEAALELITSRREY